MQHDAATRVVLAARIRDGLFLDVFKDIMLLTLICGTIWVNDNLLLSVALSEVSQAW